MVSPDENEEFEKRRKALEVEGCEAPAVQPVPLVAPAPPDLPCDVPEPEVETFFSPQADTSPATPDKQLPAPLVLLSHAFTAECVAPKVEEPEVDGSFTVPYGEFRVELVFEDMLIGELPLFSQTALYNLRGENGVVQEALQAVVDDYIGQGMTYTDLPDAEANAAAPIAELVVAGGISVSAATRLWELLLAARFDLDAAALLYAQGQTRCGYLNEELWLVCDAYSPTGYGVYKTEPDGNNAPTVPAVVPLSGLTAELNDIWDAWVDAWNDDWDAVDGIPPAPAPAPNPATPKPTTPTLAEITVMDEAAWAVLTAAFTAAWLSEYGNNDDMPDIPSLDELLLPLLDARDAWIEGWIYDWVNVVAPPATPSLGGILAMSDPTWAAAWAAAWDESWTIGPNGRIAAWARDVAASQDIGVFTAHIAAGATFSPSSVEAANAIAVSGIIPALVCVYGNAEVTVTCPDQGENVTWPTLQDSVVLSSLHGTEVVTVDNVIADGVAETSSVTLVYTVTVDAGDYTAPTQAEADAIAFAAATAALDCRVPSHRRVTDCTETNTNAGAQVGNPPTVDQVLREIATGDMGSVVPLIENVTYELVTLLGVPTYVMDTTVEAVKLQVPEGAFLAETFALANTAAEAYENTLVASVMDCNWKSREVQYSCDDSDSDPSAPNEVALHQTNVYPGEFVMGNKSPRPVYVAALEAHLGMLASPDPLRSKVYTSITPAGAFASPDSQQAADEYAANAALAELQCSYCNPRIEPVCVPVGTDTTVLPLDLSLVTSDWSTDATPGVPGIPYEPVLDLEADWVPSAGFFDPLNYGAEARPVLLCSPDPFEAATIADITGVIPIKQLTPLSRNENCRYGNDAHYAACKSTDLPSTILLDELSEPVLDELGNPVFVGFTPEGIAPDDAILLIPNVAGALNDYFSPNSTSGYVFFAADSTFGSTKEEANALARVVVLGQLNCFFESPKLNVYCGAAVGEPLPDATTFQDTAGANPVTVPAVSPGFVSTDPTHPVSSASNGAFPAKPVVIAYGYGTSRSSPQDAFDNAITLGVGQLDCYFEDARTATCTSLPDNRRYRTSGHSNNTIWINEADGVGAAAGATPLSGSLASPADGQTARFKYAGPVTFNAAGLRMQAPGVDVPSADGMGTSTLTQAAATASAFADARSKLDCTHTNWPRVNKRCPKQTDIMFSSYLVPIDALEAASTKDANIQAEALAKAMTICEPCGPFGLAVHGEQSTTPKLRLCGGSTSFGGLAGSTTGVGAKLLDCSAGQPDEFTIYELYWEDCGTPLPSGGWTIPSGVELFWVKFMCCTGEPAMVIYHEPDSQGNNEAAVAAKGFYPKVQTDDLNADAAAHYVYIGAVVGGRTGSTDGDGRKAVAYQHVDENMRFSAGGGSGGGCSGPFGVVYQDAGDWYLVGGVVSGGSFNGVIGNVTLGAVGSEPPTGTYRYLVVDYSANEEDGVLLPGGDVTDAPSPPATGSTIPSNTIPTAGSSSGQLYIPIGQWVNDVFYPSGCGNITVSHCPGSLTYSRV